jgi:hypothetical protein
MVERHLYVAPQDAEAEPVCLLTREWAARRAVSVDALLGRALREEALADGIAYYLSGGDQTWQDVTTFIAEEGECCPFLAFEVSGEGDETILRVIQPEGVM